MIFKPYIHIRQNTCSSKIEVVRSLQQKPQFLDASFEAISINEYQSYLCSNPKNIYILREEGDFNINGSIIDCDCDHCLIINLFGDDAKYKIEARNYDYKNGSQYTLLTYTKSKDFGSTDSFCKHYKRDIIKTDKYQRKVSKQEAFSIYQHLGSPKYIAAPMVCQSELAFRMFVRKYGVELCYTPMIDAQLFINSKAYQEELFQTCADDYPLVAQIAGGNGTDLLKAAKLLENHCNAIDINLGCPQPIARRHYYGSWLMENWRLISELIANLRDKLKIPIFCKIRIFESLDLSIEYSKAIAAAGCSLLTVHARPRKAKFNLEPANWSYIKAIKKEVDIPVIANGGIDSFEASQRCLDETNADGVMAASNLLKNPTIFSPDINYSVKHLASEYLQFAERYNAPINYVKPHLVYMLSNTELNAAIAACDNIKELLELIKTLPDSAITHNSNQQNNFQALFDVQ